VRTDSSTWLEVDEFMNSGSGAAFLSGAAGTGKTTGVARYVSPSTVMLAPTHKAASVLRSKGIPARTLHSALYAPLASDACACELPAAETWSPAFAKAHRKRKCTLDKVDMALNNSDSNREFWQRVSTVVLDEASMVNDTMVYDLMQRCGHVLAVGDVFQLPPIQGAPGFTEPDWELTTNHRQGAGNPILDIADRVREGSKLTIGHEAGARVSRYPLAHLLNSSTQLKRRGDVIICSTNANRLRANLHVRELLGLNETRVCRGDRIVIRDNDTQNGLYNGTILSVDSVRPYDFKNEEFYKILGTREDGDAVTIHCRAESFFEERAWQSSKAKDKGCVRAEFAFALTAHTAQGGEWGSVTVENLPFDRDPVMRRRWLYTAVTRAQKRLTVTNCR
jgi:exodeoxyribonuclease-5